MSLLVWVVGRRGRGCVASRDGSWQRHLPLLLPPNRPRRAPAPAHSLGRVLLIPDPLPSPPCPARHPLCPRLCPPRPPRRAPAPAHALGRVVLIADAGHKGDDALWRLAHGPGADGALRQHAEAVPRRVGCGGRGCGGGGGGHGPGAGGAQRQHAEAAPRCGALQRSERNTGLLGAFSGAPASLPPPPRHPVTPPSHHVPRPQAAPTCPRWSPSRPAPPAPTHPRAPGYTPASPGYAPLHPRRQPLPVQDRVHRVQRRARGRQGQGLPHRGLHPHRSGALSLSVCYGFAIRLLFVCDSLAVWTA